jgi:hypothetical protein
MAKTRVARILAISLLIVFLVLTGALFSLPLLIGDAVPVAGPSTFVSFSEETESALIAVQLWIINRAGDFSLVVEIESEEDAAPPPRLVFGMPAHEMEPLEPAVSTLSKGRFLATGRFAMPGRWEMRILRGHETHAFEFVVRP